MHPSDVPIIDRALGGLATDLPLVVTGPSGSGHTVLVLQLAKAALERGERVAILSPEPGRLLLRQALSLGIDFMDDVASDRLTILEMDPRAATSVRRHGGAALAEAVRGEVKDVSIVALDSLSHLTDEILDDGSLREFLRYALEIPTVAPRVTVATVASEELKKHPYLERALNDLCNSLIRLDRDAAGKRTISVEQCRDGVPMEGSLAFEIGLGGIRALDPPAAETKPETDAPRPSPAPAGGRFVAGAEMREHIGRAARFARETGRDSSLLVLEGPSLDVLDPMIGALDGVMRGPDVILSLGDTRLVVLLELVPECAAPSVHERLDAELSRLSVPADRIRWRCVAVTEAERLEDLKDLFSELGPWQAGEA